jgi:hypothetical protein
MKIMKLSANGHSDFRGLLKEHLTKFLQVVQSQYIVHETESVKTYFSVNHITITIKFKFNAIT